MTQTVVASPIVVFDKENSVVVGRFRYANGDYYTTPTLTDVSIFVYDLTSGNENVFSETLPATALFSDSLIVDGFSALLGDTIGRNFMHVVDPSVWAIPMTGGHVYRWEARIGTTGAGVTAATIDIVTRPLISA